MNFPSNPSSQHLLHGHFLAVHSTIYLNELTTKTSFLMQCSDVNII